MDGICLLTDSDLDAGLVELDGGRPGDEAGTEKEYLVDHGCCDVDVCCLVEDQRGTRAELSSL